MQRIFVVEDDEEIARSLMRLLGSEGFGVVCASTQCQALVMLAQEQYDLALVDISLPDGSGYAVCTEIKRLKDVPVIFLTAFGDEASVVTGLNMGADDYIIKPFRIRELVARIRVALRKAQPGLSVVEVGDLRIDLAGGIVKKGEREIMLSALEYRLLLVFCNNPRGIITRERLLNELWDSAGEFVTDNTLTVYVKRLREKIEEDPSSPRIIQTVRGMGYRLGDGSKV